MTEREMPEFVNAWCAHHEVAGKPRPSKSSLVVVFRCLREYALADILQAMKQHLRTSPYAPKPSDIVQLIEGSVQDKALMAWQEVQGCVGRHGYPASIRFSDPAIVYAVERMGGWEQVCVIARDVLPFREQDFSRHYGAAKRAGVTWASVPPYCMGWEERTRKRDGYALELPEVIDALTGKPVENVAVLESGETTSGKVAALAETAVKRASLCG